ncbi:BON domain-containing protein [Sphingomonas sp. ID1715]|uniref:BON domain-containing protein n=1 Tax=Sphingomonas sp. ID1715 TaxID=1656898 RepID=UPI0014878B66|nr:BON domain-containing protein [Sphingomonas sp. ID1715]NNM76461.1 BON domain-containing protein [Sphingomonas sp. ID1715]
MKSDAQLQRDVIAELEADPLIDHTQIGVSVTDGVVTLNGLVRSYAEKMAAEKDARRISGVQAIAEEIKVRFPSDPKTSDSEIAKRIVDVFGWNVLIPNGKIDVKVENGWVTLSGVVDYGYQHDAAKKAAGQISGVMGVSDLIELRLTPVASTVRDRVKSAIRRQADRDADTIFVATEGGTVTLSGRVSGWAERRIAEQAALGSPGVSKVIDRIAIAA